MKIGSLIAAPARSSSGASRASWWPISSRFRASRESSRSSSRRLPTSPPTLSPRPAPRLARGAGREFKAVYAVSSKLATVKDEARLYSLLLAPQRPGELRGRRRRREPTRRRHATPSATPRAWAKAYRDARSESRNLRGRPGCCKAPRTTTYWTNVASDGRHMPFIVLDEGGARGNALLTVPLRARPQLGALILVGRRGAFDTSLRRVLGILANQAAAALQRVADARSHPGAGGARWADGPLQPSRFQRPARGAAGLAASASRKASACCSSTSTASRSSTTPTATLPGCGPARDGAGARGPPASGRLRGTLRWRGIRRHPPDTDENAALQVAERIRKAIENDDLMFEGTRIKWTSSIGVAMSSGEVTPAALIEAADKALYEAKESGRNRVVVAPTVKGSLLDSSARHERQSKNHEAPRRERHPDSRCRAGPSAPGSRRLMETRRRRTTPRWRARRTL